METKTVTLRCECGAEAVTFNKYIYTYTDEPYYEIHVEDSYIGAGYSGFFGRFRRAWRALTLKPVVYNGIFTEDKEKMKTFLLDSLALLEE